MTTPDLSSGPRSQPAVSDHPGVLIRLRQRAPLAAALTRFAATHDTGPGHYLALRGDPSPLSWTLGWPAVNTATDRWEAAFLSWEEGAIAYKWLYDDQGCESGGDRALEAGGTSEDTPGF